MAHLRGKNGNCPKYWTYQRLLINCFKHVQRAKGKHISRIKSVRPIPNRYRNYRKEWNRYSRVESTTEIKHSSERSAADLSRHMKESVNLKTRQMRFSNLRNGKPNKWTKKKRGLEMSASLCTMGVLEGEERKRQDEYWRNNSWKRIWWKCNNPILPRSSVNSK